MTPADTAAATAAIVEVRRAHVGDRRTRRKAGRERRMRPGDQPTGAC